MARRTSFVFYTDCRQHLDLLSDAERGKLLSAIFDYVETGKIANLKGMPKMAFSFIKAQIDRDDQKFHEKCERNRENGKKGGRPSKPKKAIGFNDNQTEPNGFSENRPKPKKAENENENENDIPPISPTGELDRLFSQFWAAYPKKRNKPGALMAFKRIKPDAGVLSAMLKAIESERQTDQWRRDGGQYIPYPATWLNGRRWEDEASRFTESDPWKGVPRL